MLPLSSLSPQLSLSSSSPMPPLSSSSLLSLSSSPLSLSPSKHHCHNDCCQCYRHCHNDCCQCYRHCHNDCCQCYRHQLTMFFLQLEVSWGFVLLIKKVSQVVSLCLLSLVTCHLTAIQHFDSGKTAHSASWTVQFCIDSILIWLLTSSLADWWFIYFWWGGGGGVKGGERLGERGGSKGLRDGVCVCVCVCMCVRACVRACVWMQGRGRGRVRYVMHD